MDEETVEQIQTKIAFLERANAELSDVVYRQQQEIRALGARLDRLADRLETARAEEREPPSDHERPPHY